MQEGSRKDIERGFGQLQGAFRIVANPIQAMKLPRVSNIVLTCVILHNMRVEEYVSGRNNKYKPDDGIDVEPLDEYSDPSRTNTEHGERIEEGKKRCQWMVRRVCE